MISAVREGKDLYQRVLYKGADALTKKGGWLGIVATPRVARVEYGTGPEVVMTMFQQSASATEGTLSSHGIVIWKPGKSTPAGTLASPLLRLELCVGCS